MTSGQLARYFDKWAKERAGAAGVDGVYVLICTDPRHVQVIVWPESRDKTFPARDREDLRKYLAKQLNKEPDQTLLSAVAQVRAAIQARQPVEPVSYSTFWIVGGVILAFLTVWLILGLMRSKLASRDQTEDVAGSSASYVPGLLGGMFGSLAGYWIYDRLFHGGPSKPTASEDVAYDGSKQTPADPALNDNENAPV